jgi:hypothetical protein
MDSNVKLLNTKEVSKLLKISTPTVIKRARIYLPDKTIIHLCPTFWNDYEIEKLKEKRKYKPRKTAAQKEAEEARKAEKAEKARKAREAEEAQNELRNKTLLAKEKQKMEKQLEKERFRQLSLKSIVSGGLW